MSDDIVARLRQGGIFDDPYMLQHAAEEIERLRAELAAERELREREKDAAVAMLQVKIDALASERKAKTIYYDEWQDANNERDALRAQLDEAREALEWLVTLKDEKDTHGKTPLYEARKKAAWASARAMLDKIKGDGDEGL